MYVHIYVTFHGKRYVNDISLKPAKKTDDERIANALQNCQTGTPNVLTIWVEFCERFKTKFQTLQITIL